jgi:hypothetical protein
MQGCPLKLRTSKPGLGIVASDRESLDAYNQELQLLLEETLCKIQYSAAPAVDDLVDLNSVGNWFLKISHYLLS